MIKYSMEVSKKGEIKPGAKTAKYVKVGAVDVTVPTLSDVAEFASAKPISTDADGLPVYFDTETSTGDKRAQWLFDAIFAAVKANARNKLIPESAEVKPGQIIPSNWDEFTAESAGNKGDALAVIREAKTAFAAWVSKQGLSDNAVQVLNLLFGNKAALATQGAKQRAKFSEFLTAFMESLDDAQTARFERHLTALATALEAGESADDWTM